MSAKQKMKLNIVNGGPAELDAPLEVLARPEQAPAFDRRLLRAEGRALRASSYGFETEIQGLNMDELDVESYEGTFVMDHKLLSPLFSLTHDELNTKCAGRALSLLTGERLSN